MKINTTCVHGGYKAESGKPQVMPIAQSTTYRYYDGEEIAKLFDLESADYMYSRLGNPTVSGLEAKMAELEGGTMGIATSSGMSATFITIFNICNAGDHIVSSKSIYGGTYNLFTVTLKKMGIDCTLIDQDAPAEEIAKAIQPNTKLIFAESLGNPSLKIIDFEKFGKIAKDAGVPLVIDNTLATPYLCKPLELGADIVVHSTSKYADGHASALGGVVVEGGKFDWAKSDKFPGITEPDPSYHGLKFYEKFGSVAFSIKLRAQMLRDFGCVMTPMNAYLTMQGLQTLHLRMEKHSENALAIAKYLEKHPNVEWVSYPGLESNSDYQLARKYLPKGQSGVLSFGIKGGRVAGEGFLNKMELASLVVHVGDVRTCALHPASSTHRQMSEEDQIKAGITPDLIRLSVGIEDVEDIIEDLNKALA